MWVHVGHSVTSARSIQNRLHKQNNSMKYSAHTMHGERIKHLTTAAFNGHQVYFTEDLVSPVKVLQ